MIEQTFLHLPGVGTSLERRLWHKGYSSWEDLASQLQRVDSIRELFEDRRQLELFPRSAPNKKRSRVVEWLVCLDQSRVALNDRDYAFFVDRLKPAEHWRLLSAISQNILYLDIETTGLSRSLHYVTVIGALFNGEFYQWRWPEPLDDLGLLIREAAIVVTFNGKRFDLPFLRSHASSLPSPRAHVDLLYVARAAGCKGGQKEIEAALGLLRPSSLSDIDGETAVALWCAGLYGNSQAYDRLLQYNRADVEMMPQIATILCDKMAQQISDVAGDSKTQHSASPSRRSFLRGEMAAPYQSLQCEWRQRKPRFELFEVNLSERLGRTPLIVGVDLRAKEENPTGWALCEGMKTTTRVVYDDDTILKMTVEVRPDLVSIDAPLALPRGRNSVSDDSPCRSVGGIVRDAERILWARGIRVYPALIRQMQGLTRRGIALTRKLQDAGIDVIESYPGAAQDVLGIPRKGLDEGLLQRGLEDFGFQLEGKYTHDELDAITSALVGFFYLADRYEAIGAEDECFMILPRWNSMHWTGRPARIGVSLLGYEQNLVEQLAEKVAGRIGWKSFNFNEEPTKRTLELQSGIGGVFTSDTYDVHRFSVWNKYFDSWLWITADPKFSPMPGTTCVPEVASGGSLTDRLVREVLTTRLRQQIK